MKWVNFILYLLAALCFFVAMLGWASGNSAGEHRPRININVLALGLLFWVAVALIAAGRALD